MRPRGGTGADAGRRAPRLARRRATRPTRARSWNRSVRTGRATAARRRAAGRPRRGGSAGGRARPGVAGVPLRACSPRAATTGRCRDLVRRSRGRARAGAGTGLRQRALDPRHELREVTGRRLGTRHEQVRRAGLQDRSTPVDLTDGRPETSPDAISPDRGALSPPDRVGHTTRSGAGRGVGRREARRAAGTHRAPPTGRGLGQCTERRAATDRGDHAESRCRPF